MFHRECGKDSVRYQRTGCSVVTDEFFQNLSMKWSRMQWNDAGLAQPFANDCKCFLGRSRIRPDSGTGADANKCPHRYPRQADYSATLEQFLKPLCRGLLLRRIGVIGVQEQVGVDDGQLWRSPSPYSRSDSMLS